MRTRATPCAGAVTIEFHPPLADPGIYQFELSGPDLEPCAFSVSLPQAHGEKGTSACRLPRELRTQMRDAHVSISELTFAAAPEHFELQVERNGEHIYRADLEPKYAPYPTARAENERFCGDRARVVPACLRGSSECQPFPATCLGPEGCPHGQACCLTPEWGRDFGPKAASECAARASCFAHFGQLACHTDDDCPADLRCKSSALAADFSPAVLTCVHR